MSEAQNAVGGHSRRDVDADPATWGFAVDCGTRSAQEARESAGWSKVGTSGCAGPDDRGGAVTVPYDEETAHRDSVRGLCGL
ncbi:hypothetical protein [Williamsia sp. M5A3_1d]